MKTTYFDNRINISFTLKSKGADHVNQVNAIRELSQRHKGQSQLFQNESPIKYDSNGNVVDYQFGITGGSITFHANLCNHEQGAKKMIELLELFGLKNEEYREVVKTRRPNGSAYKKPQTFIERI